jgi:hypothetical protein
MSGTTEKQKRPSTQAKRKKDVKPSSFKGERKKKGAMRWGKNHGTENNNKTRGLSAPALDSR